MLNLRHRIDMKYLNPTPSTNLKGCSSTIIKYVRAFLIARSSCSQLLRLTPSLLPPIVGCKLESFLWVASLCGIFLQLSTCACIVDVPLRVLPLYSLPQYLHATLLGTLSSTSAKCNHTVDLLRLLSFSTCQLTVLLCSPRPQWFLPLFNLQTNKTILLKRANHHKQLNK